MCAAFHRRSDPIVRFSVAPSRRSALLRPRMRAAGGLDRASLEPQERNCRRPRVNLVTTRGDGTIVEFSSTVAIRSPLHIARRGAHGSAAPGHDSLSSLDSLPGRRHARQRPRIARSDRTALRPQARAPDPSNWQRSWRTTRRGSSRRSMKSRRSRTFCGFLRCRSR